VTKLEDGDLIEFTAEVDVRPEFELPDFSTLEATVEALDVPDSLIDSQIAALQQRFGSRETVERPAAEGDVATLRLVASRDGEALPDATAEDVEYTVGSGTMIDGLDEAVIGLSAGESATFSSTLVGGSLSGEPADVEVTVTKVQAQELPEADDEFAQQASEFDTMAELRADIVDRLTRVARLEQASQARDAVLVALLDRLDIEVPENLLESELQARREQITQQLNDAGLTIEDYLRESGDDQTAEEFWADVEQRSTQAMKAQMVLDKVAEDQGIGVDQNDLTQHILRKAQADGVSPQQVADHLKEHPHHVEEYVLEIRRAKALALVVESASVSDSSGERVELATLTEDGTYAAEAPAAGSAAASSAEDPADSTAEPSGAAPGGSDPAEQSAG
jgi:trigger factor